jgi:ABC-type ATPase with predicted acetyltransferase domain
VVDCFGHDIVAGLRTLSAVGLGDVFSLLNRPGRLSDGQQHRFRLAQALTAGKPFVFADEFCSALDRITAAALAYNVHRLARRTGTTLVLASSRDDILLDLAPDVLIIKDFSGPAQVIYKTAREGRAI